MTSELLAVIPNLSIGVVCIGALVYITVRFLEKLDERAMAHESAMSERETALRGVEREIRTELVGALGRSSEAIAQNTRIMERVVTSLDRK